MLSLCHELHGSEARADMDGLLDRVRNPEYALQYWWNRLLLFESWADCFGGKPLPVECVRFELLFQHAVQKPLLRWCLHLHLSLGTWERCRRYDEYELALCESADWLFSFPRHVREAIQVDIAHHANALIACPSEALAQRLKELVGWPRHLIATLYSPKAPDPPSPPKPFRGNPRVRAVWGALP